MKKLIVVRHGSHDTQTMSLTNEGKAQIAKLIEKLREHTVGNSVHIITSNEFRALQSGIGINSALGGSAEASLLLLPPARNVSERLPEVLGLVRLHHDKDVLILVTHSEYTTVFPMHFGQMEFGKTFRSISIKNGEAWVIDCESQTCVLVTQ